MRRTWTSRNSRFVCHLLRGSLPLSEEVIVADDASAAAEACGMAIAGRARARRLATRRFGATVHKNVAARAVAPPSVGALHRDTSESCHSTG